MVLQEFFLFLVIFESLSNGGTFVEGLQAGINLFAFMPHRIYAIMNNTILISVPMFVFMGIILQKSRLAERLLEAMGFLFGEIRGGLAISTVLVGALLAASTGVVGASVIAMGVISLPVMMKYNYSKSLACGTICASGTLGQIIPPSVVLIILGLNLVVLFLWWGDFYLPSRFTRHKKSEKVTNNEKVEKRAEEEASRKRFNLLWLIILLVLLNIPIVYALIEWR